MKKLTLALAGLLALSAPAFADGDADKGENVFKKCKACHMVGEDAKNRVGPALNNIFGAVAGSHDFKYSDAMIAKGEEGLVWTAETLDAYLENPRAYIKGTKMSFAGLKKEKDRENVIAYLMQFSPDYDPEAGEEAEEAESQ
ncbi:cytochrome c [Maritalea mobilis]|uniref:Cytochrome c n=1 Tax=Maritalea mobilis TaxID=483324 RepID=A0A4R6VS53_9HYPH|nr:cytochrome c family protein [Maritalea mobilis]TDQ66852.1 cytochrome c [Maritalea mobilis]